MKKIYVVDWLLIPFSILSIFSGFKLHIAGHGNIHEIWHNWNVFHVMTSVLFLVFAIFHIIMHWGWYISLMRNGIGRKSKMTVILSLIVMLVTVTGFILLFCVDGSNSEIGLWHYKIGIVVSIISIIHIIKRLPILYKNSILNHYQGRKP